jgi:hypothetical protein
VKFGTEIDHKRIYSFYMLIVTDLATVLNSEIISYTLTVVSYL